MNQYPKALVAQNQYQLKKAMIALDLKEPEWFPMLLHQAIAGRRFSRIVILPMKPASRVEEEQMARRIGELHCRLMPSEQHEFHEL